MKKIIIGASGDVGSFSAQASKEYARTNNIINYEIKYLISVEKVLKELDEKKIDLGVFPIENSNGGIVIESINAMSKHIFKIKNIFEIPVVQCLLTKPGIEKEDIKTIASHDQALKQCKTYLKRSWTETELTETEDTAKSAKELSEGILSEDTAVLAPESCATLYGLIVMEKGIQDLKFNFTNFLVVEK
ncbi:MAG: prephenate dehydratase domain-containing protein [Patescibacteria group bacterium]|nr:prephenate dehydratase domain-containing protein [Patescibacteria group bacterium]